MRLYIKVNDKKIIEDIKFHTLGCAAAIATSDMACDLARGKTLKEALKIDYKKIIKKLGDLPPIKIHCSVLAKEGLKAAVKNYYERRKKGKE
jgi:nitrogen fixation NifU-like protein